MARYCGLDGQWRLPVYDCERAEITEASREVHFVMNMVYLILFEFYLFIFNSYIDLLIISLISSIFS